KIHAKEIKPSEVTEALFERIEKYDGDIKAFITLTKDEAIERAKELDQLQAEDKMDGELFGIPVGIKDNIVTKDVLTTCASKMLHKYNPVYNAIDIIKEKEKNCFFLGKANMYVIVMYTTT